MEPDLIRTERLTLRRPVQEDLAAAVALHTDPAANVYRPGGARTEAEAATEFARWRTVWAENGLCYWAVEHRGTVIGFGGLSKVRDEDHDERVLNIYYRFTPAAWGNGFATEMVTAAVDYAHRALPDIPLSIVTAVDNAASLRLAERLGFVEHRRHTRGGQREVVLREPQV